MRQLETLLEEYNAEMEELGKAYTTFTDVVGNHIETQFIEKALQDQMIILTGKINQVEAELEAHNAQFKGEKEYDPEYENYVNNEKNKFRRKCNYY